MSPHPELGNTTYNDSRCVASPIWGMPGDIRAVTGQIDGIYLPSYVMISSQGRVNVINRIFNDSLKCADTGREILHQMQDVYPAYRLARKIRKAPEDVSDADLQNRLEKLGSDLDRIRAAYIKTS